MNAATIDTDTIVSNLRTERGFGAPVLLSREVAAELVAVGEGVAKVLCQDEEGRLDQLLWQASSVMAEAFSRGGNFSVFATPASMPAEEIDRKEELEEEGEWEAAEEIDFAPEHRLTIRYVRVRGASSFFLVTFR